MADRRAHGRPSPAKWTTSTPSPPPACARASPAAALLPPPRPPRSLSSGCTVLHITREEQQREPSPALGSPVPVPSMPAAPSPVPSLDRLGGAAVTTPSVRPCGAALRGACAHCRRGSRRRPRCRHCARPAAPGASWCCAHARSGCTTWAGRPARCAASAARTAPRGSARLRAPPSIGAVPSLADGCGRRPGAPRSALGPAAKAPARPRRAFAQGQPVSRPPPRSVLSHTGAAGPIPTRGATRGDAAARARGVTNGPRRLAPRARGTAH